MTSPTDVILDRLGEQPTKGIFENLRKELDALSDPASLQTSLEFGLRKGIDRVLRKFALTERNQEILGPVNEIIEESISLTEANHLRPHAVFIFIEDVFEALSVVEVMDWFEFVETHSDEFRSIVSLAAQVNAIVVRSLGGLLKRLSKATDVVFCGRILAALSRILPLSDPSGLNKKGTVNDQNQIQLDVETTDSMDVDTSSSSSRVANKFHQQFWTFMKLLQNPRNVEPQMEWADFRALADTVLSTFSSISSLEKNAKNGGPGETVDTYYPKFLTSPQLIELQTQDPYFRRHILVQFLIFLMALSRSSTKGKFDYEISPSRKKIVKIWRQKTLSLLKSTPPDGVEFTESITSILSREEHWVDWKRGGCLSFVKDSREPPVLKEVVPVAPMTLGNESLKDLWATPLTLEDSEPTPSFSRVVQPAIDELEDEDEDDPSLFLVNSHLFKWRAYRVLARHKYSTVETLRTSKEANPLQHVLEDMSEKLTAAKKVRKAEEAKAKEEAAKAALLKEEEAKKLKEAKKLEEEEAASKMDLDAPEGPSESPSEGPPDDDNPSPSKRARTE